MQQTVNLPNGTSATGVSIRDGFTNDAFIVVYDKEGKIAGIVTGQGTTVAATVSGAANTAITTGMAAGTAAAIK